MGICPISIDQYSTRNIIGIATTGTSPWSYNLSINNSLVGTYNTSKNYYIFIHQFTEIGSNIPYKMDIVDSLGNHETETCNITVNPGTTTLTVQLSINPTTITLNQSVTFTANASGGLAPYSYQWTNLPTPCTGTSTSNTITCTPNSAGTYNISVTVTDANNNTATATGTLVVNPTLIPAVVAITPASGATGVSVSTTVTASFNEAMDSSTINTSTFLLQNSIGASIPANVSYNQTTFVATLTPSNPLAYSTTYMAIVKGGSNGVKDTSGNVMTTDYSWSFTTKSQLQQAYSIWPSSSIPSIITDPDTSAVELGVKFRADLNGYITGIRFYKGPSNTGTHVGSLWSITGTLLGRITFTGETSTGWQQAIFSTPIPITANTTYIASYHTNVGQYSVNENYFATTGVDNPPLHALKDGVDGGNGVYNYNTNPIFPTQTYLSSNYWVDIVFQSDVQIPLSVTLSVDKTTITLGQSVTFTATPSGGNSPYTYVWQNLPTPCSGNSATILCTPDTTGTFSNINVTVTDSTGTNAISNNVTLTVNPAPQCSITVTNPTSGAIFRKGTTKTITWTSQNAGSNVKIELLKAGIFVRSITSSTANDGSYSWRVPSITSGTDYQIKITSLTTTSCSGTSGKFTIR